MRGLHRRNSAANVGLGSKASLQGDRRVSALPPKCSIGSTLKSAHAPELIAQGYEPPGSVSADCSRLALRIENALGHDIDGVFLFLAQAASQLPAPMPFLNARTDCKLPEHLESLAYALVLTNDAVGLRVLIEELK